MKILAGEAWKTFITLINSKVKDNFVLKLVAKEYDLQFINEGPKIFQTFFCSEGVIYNMALA